MRFYFFITSLYYFVWVFCWGGGGIVAGDMPRYFIWNDVYALPRM